MPIGAEPRMKTISRKKALFWLGLLIYALSFALVAEADRWPGRDQTHGYAAAIASLLVPLAGNPFTDPWLFHNVKLAYVSL
jgi:hypothetical protein